MSEGGGVVKSRSFAGDQLELVQRPAPLKHSRLSHTSARTCGDSLRHILDSVPFTPSQGVRTPSPRKSNDARSYGNHFFRDEEEFSPPALAATVEHLHRFPWTSGSICQDASITSHQHSSPLHGDAQLFGVHTVHTPRSQSQASTSSGSPRGILQQDGCGRVMASHQNAPHPSIQISGQPGPPAMKTQESDQVNSALNHAYGQLSLPFNRLYCAENYGSANYLSQVPAPHPRPSQPLHSISRDCTPFSQPPSFSLFGSRSARLPPMPPGPVTPHGDGRPLGMMCRHEHPKDRTQVSPQVSPPREKRSNPWHNESAQMNLNNSQADELPNVKVLLDSQRGMSCCKADSDAISSSTESPNPESPMQHLKSKIEVKISNDGQLVFNARQRRTLRRALQRQRKLEVGDGKGFSLDSPISGEERKIVVDVVQVHIGRPLPESTDVNELVKTLLSLGTGDGEG